MVAATPGRLLGIVLSALAACTSAGSAQPSAPADGGPEAGACPDTPPPGGDPCAVAAQTPCVYGDRCAPVTFACIDGAWADVTPSTMPPPPCPDVAPGNGGTCAPCASAYRCDYNTRCAPDGGSSVIGTCAGGHWLVGAVACEAGAGD